MSPRLWSLFLLPALLLWIDESSAQQVPTPLSSGTPAPAAATPGTPAASAPASSTPAGTPVPPAQEALKEKAEYTGRNAVGLMAGVGSGIGLGYRRYVSDRLAIRGAGYIFYIPDAINLFSLGVTAQYDVRRERNYVLYGVGSLSFAHATAPALDMTGVGFSFFPAVGVGYERGKHDGPGLTYQFELQLTTVIVEGDFKTLLPLPQVGAHYNF